MVKLKVHDVTRLLMFLLYLQVSTYTLFRPNFCPSHIASQAPMHKIPKNHNKTYNEARLRFVHK